MSENTDISKLKLNNKLYNIEFLMKKNIFKILCNISDNITDSSIAYIPWFNYTATIEISKNKFKDFCFLAPCVENNYADLSFINNEKYTNIKACRIKTFNAISMDGNLLTYNKDTINDSNFLVFYSINPLECNKVLIMNTYVYNFLVSNNNNEHIRYFNADDVNKIKKTFKFSDSQLNFIDYSKEILLSEPYEKNINIKRLSCLKTLYKIKTSKNKNFNIKTHYGHQYSAFNLISGEIRQFRDAIARNNFFKSIGVKLSDNHNIIKNCKNMTKIVNGDNIESYRTNILDNGWIICEYIADTIELIKYIKKLIDILNLKSKKLANRIKKILSKTKQEFTLTVKNIIKTTEKIKINLKNKFIYFRPLRLLNYVTNCNHNIKTT